MLDRTGRWRAGIECLATLRATENRPWVLAEKNGANSVVGGFAGNNFATQWHVSESSASALSGTDGIRCVAMETTPRRHGG